MLSKFVFAGKIKQVSKFNSYESGCRYGHYNIFERLKPFFALLKVKKC